MDKNEKQQRLQELDAQTIEVTQHKGTEPAFTGKHLDTDKDGTYKCVVCGAPLFSSNTKFKSGTGWPSFTDVMDSKAVRLEEDTSHGMTRQEVICNNCDAHLGHVFPDGPSQAEHAKGTGKRFCINSCALNFSEENK